MLKSREGTEIAQRQATTGARPDNMMRHAMENAPSPEGPNRDPNKYDVFLASQMKYNPAAAAVKNIIDRDFEIMPRLRNDEYSPFDEEETHTWEGIPADVVKFSQSPKETAHLVREYNQYQDYNKTLDSAGAYGVVSSVAAAVLSPASLVPLFGYTNKISNASRGLLVGSGTAASVETLNELMLHKYDKTRTLEESSLNVLGAAVAGGLVGGIVGKIGESAEVGKFLAKQAEDSFNAESRMVNRALQMEEHLQIRETVPGKSGIYVIEPKDISKYEQIEQIQGPLLRTIAKINPIRTLGSYNPLTRTLAAMMGEQNVVGTTFQAVESRMKTYNAMWHGSAANARSVWKKAGGRRLMDYRKFGDEIAVAMRNGDRHDIPAVAEAAKGYRKIVDEIKSRSVKEGLLEEGHLTKFAESYFPRIYHVRKLKKDQNNFINTVTDYLAKQNPGGSIEEIRESAMDIYQKLSTTNAQAGHHKMIVPKSGFLKGRQIPLPDNVLAPWLASDPEAIIHQYAKHMGAEIEMQRMFGSTDLKKELDDVDKWWVQAKSEAMKSGMSERKLAKMEKQRMNDMNDLVALRDRLLSRYRMPDNPDDVWVRASKTTRNFMALRYLGGMTLSAFPDMARPVWQHGIYKSTKAIMKIVAHPTLRKMNKAQLNQLGVAIEHFTGSRLHAMHELDRNPYGATMVENFVEDLTQGRGFGTWVPDMGKVTLMSQWNDGLKRFSGVLAQDELLKKVAMPNKYAKDIKRAGMTPDMARRINEQFKKHGERYKKVRFANSEAWDDIEAEMAYSAAISREVDSTIITPGIMDRPLWMSSEGGKLIGSMKSFAFASTNKQLLAGLNNMDANVIQGMIISTMLGGLSVYIKGLVANKTHEEIVGAGIHEFLWAAASASGTMGITSELADVAQTRFGDAASMYTARREAINMLGGPVVGTIGDASDALMGDQKAMARMVPYNNLFYINAILKRANLQDGSEEMEYQ